MSPEQTAAIVTAAAARAMIRAFGMAAENSVRERHGDALAYDESAFVALIDEEQIDHNAVVTTLRSAQ